MILIASDHAGLPMKEALAAHLRERGHDVRDLGPQGAESVDYPAYAHRLARVLAAEEGSFGILVCGTGIGMSMSANRHPGVRAALCHDAYTAAMARRHNHANVLCLGQRVLGPGVAEQVVDVFLATEPEGGRHARRVAMIDDPAAGGEEES